MECQVIGEYYTFFIQPKTGWGKVFKAYWKGDMVDLLRQRDNRIFNNMPDAERALQAAQAKWRADREVENQPK